MFEYYLLFKKAAINQLIEKLFTHTVTIPQNLSAIVWCEKYDVIMSKKLERRSQ